MKTTLKGFTKKNFASWLRKQPAQRKFHLMDSGTCPGSRFVEEKLLHKNVSHIVDYGYSGEGHKIYYSPKWFSILFYNLRSRLLVDGWYQVRRVATAADIREVFNEF